ncbi:MAG TPA: YeeE/YedE family protein [Lysobacter sp.]
MKPVVHGVVAGALFGLGLAVSGMTNPDKVLNFLDVAGHWDPSLALVMGAALAVSLPGFAWARRRGCALTGEPLPAPPASTIDRRLLFGSALFGFGWGVAGYCPGPALANLAHGTLEAVVFVTAMLAGSQLARLLARA